MAAKIRTSFVRDTIGIVTTFKAVVLEGVEVVFIVMALGTAGRALLPAAISAAAALLLVVALGAALHRSLTRVPENNLKFGVGLLLSAFDVFWIGKGAGFAWPGSELAIIALVIGFALVALGAARLTRTVTPAPQA